MRKRETKKELEKTETEEKKKLVKSKREKENLTNYKNGTGIEQVKGMKERRKEKK